MHPTTVAVDLAKDVFQLAWSEPGRRCPRAERIASRERFARTFENRAPLRIIMEACGSAHDWGRRFLRLGHQVRLLPAHDVRPYVRRDKTDRADAEALLEADRNPRLVPVPVKSPGQQSVQALHRVREHLKATRTASINLLRGVLREFGIVIAQGARHVRPAALAALEDADNDLAPELRQALASLLDQIQACTSAMVAIEHQLDAFAQRDVRSQRYRQVTGIGPITATALSASVGDLHRFRSGRHFAAWLGITPREHSSGRSRRLGRISRRGDTYLRTLLVHGARSALRAAGVRARREQPLDRLATWALALQLRVGHNRAAVALANKLARRLWAAEHHGRPFDPDHRSTLDHEHSAPAPPHHAATPRNPTPD